MFNFEGSVPVPKVQKYELMFIRFLWVFLLLGFIYKFLFTDYALLAAGKYSSFINDCLYVLFVSVWLLIKSRLLNQKVLENKYIYILNRAIGLIIISFSIVIIGSGPWTYVVIILAILMTSLTRGASTAIGLTVFSFIIQSLMLYFYPSTSSDPNTFNGSGVYEKVALLVLTYVSITLLAKFCGNIYINNLENEKQNQGLLRELEEKYDQIAVAQEEIKFHYEKLKATNFKLEETNKKLTDNIAEFYTLQQISQAIGSILDIKELLKYVNDIILGVMGVNYSTIILKDEKRNRLKVERTNIKNHEQLVILKDSIECPLLTDVLNSGKPVMENFVDPDLYTFTKGREVNSLICVPLSSKTKKFGLVLVEHRYFNAFDEENMRLLDIIGQQVGIAMENAELYQKMQELATIDGLTGVYNRLYFQERLQNEIRNAKEGNYELGVAIFDIDLFKDFNDTYGHLFGDKVIRQIAENVKNSLRSSDVIARFGGEEFVILFPRTGLKEAYEKAEALREKIASTIIRDNLVESSVTASFGVSCYPEFAGTEGELLRSADNALYDAKASGRNCVKTAKKA